jgi:hypothetical protein
MILDPISPSLANAGTWKTMRCGPPSSKSQIIRFWFLVTS